MPTPSHHGECRGLPACAIYRVSAAGHLHRLGTLRPVRPDGFVMCENDGGVAYTEGLPWWLLDMRPQGFLGRAYAQQFGPTLGLSPQVQTWTDTQALRALLIHGSDGVGNLLLGDGARDQFLHALPPIAIPHADKGARYARLAAAAATVGVYRTGIPRCFLQNYCNGLCVTDFASVDLVHEVETRA